MLPSEMIILMAIAIDKKTGKKLLPRASDITNEYIGSLYNSLVTRGYLEGNSASGYQLSPLGMKAISVFLRENKTMSKEVVKRLELLGIIIGPAQEQKIS